jgi:transcriptional regulator with GAF, ATPase, and Fis domain
MQRVLEIAQQLANTHATALIQEVAREGGHRQSYPCLEPSGQPFLDHHRCTTIPESLMESELFGHERGLLPVPW